MRAGIIFDWLADFVDFFVIKKNQKKEKKIKQPISDYEGHNCQRERILTSERGSVATNGR